MLKIVNILLVSVDGDLLMQHRDDKPGISNPGKITAFGGHVEDDETYLEAAVRELKEETGLGVLVDELERFGTYRKTIKDHGEDSTVEVFLLEGIIPEEVTVYEGQGLYVVHPDDDLDKINFSILARRFVGEYLKRVTK